MANLFQKLNKSKVFKDLNEKEFSWVLYDVGNSAFTMLSCSLIPIWFKNLACLYTKHEETVLITEKALELLDSSVASATTAAMATAESDIISSAVYRLLDSNIVSIVKEAVESAEAIVIPEIEQAAHAVGLLSQTEATSQYALAISIVTIITALIGPVCGAIADHKDKKKIFFSTTVAIGVIGCILNGFAPGWVMFIVVYIIAKIFYQASLTFYDSMLNDITTEERADAVSSYGYAWGYIGSCIPFLVALIAYVLGPDMLGIISEFLSKLIGFTVTGVWWLIVSLPLMKNYQQLYYVENEKNAIGHAFIKILKTLKKIVFEDKKILFFLLAFFLYIDGVGTIIDNCINIGTELGLSTVGQVIFLLLTQVVAWIGSLVFAKLSNKHATGKLILVCICGYFVVCIYALFLSELYQFAIMAFGVGCFQGSIQSLSRSYFAKIIPAENSGEYFGLYDIFSKGASFLGSAAIALICAIPGGNINLAVGSLAIFFALGFIFLKIADKIPNKNA